MAPPRSIFKTLPLRLRLPAQIPQLQKSYLSTTITKSAPNTAAEDHQDKAASKTDIQNKRSAQQNLHGIDRQSYEYSLSGTDDAVAQENTVSFDPTQSTDPAHAKDMAGRNSPEGNPLEISAANPEVSSAVTEVRYRKKEKATVTYASQGDRKGKAGGVPENKATAGMDKRRSDRPQDVRAGSMAPGSR